MDQANGGALWVDEPGFTPRRLKIACVGAGLSGLFLAHKIQNDPSNSHLELNIYEKNSDVGGTWLENVYPGVACDIPAHSYAFPFAPNPDWSAYYVSGAEIQGYIKRTVKALNLDKNVRFGHRVIGARWDDEQGQWLIRVMNESNEERTDTAHILINAGGFLNNPQWPKIDGLQSFRKNLVHSAQWPAGLDLKGKRVGLIGNGSSAIQILPKIVQDAAHIVTYVRSPTWVATPLAADQSKGGQNFAYSEEEKQKFREDPELLKETRKDIEHRMNKRFPGVLAGSDMSEEARKALTKLMCQRLGHDQAMMEALIPKFPVACRRITPGEGYLEALQAKNVTVRFNRIKAITGNGIALTDTDDGTGDEEDELDIIICATGFDVSFIPTWPIQGLQEKILAEVWRTGPSGYLGLAVPHMPNYFVLCGPNSPVSQGSLTTVIDFVSDYIIKWCNKIATQHIKSIAVNEDANREYNEYMQEFLKRTVWAGDCRSWYKNGTTDGKVTGIYGGSMVHYYEMLEAFRTEDFDIRYASRNRFTCMGNGRSRKEFTDENLGFYV